MNRGPRTLVPVLGPSPSGTGREGAVSFRLIVADSRGSGENLGADLVRAAPRLFQECAAPPAGCPARVGTAASPEKSHNCSRCRGPEGKYLPGRRGQRTGPQRCRFDLLALVVYGCVSSNSKPACQAPPQVQPLQPVQPG
jgi:hypothetical protein